jgi:hypothetical protein
MRYAQLATYKRETDVMSIGRKTETQIQDLRDTLRRRPLPAVLRVVPAKLLNGREFHAIGIREKMP